MSDDSYFEFNSLNEDNKMLMNTINSSIVYDQVDKNKGKTHFETNMQHGIRLQHNPTGIIIDREGRNMILINMFYIMSILLLMY